MATFGATLRRFRKDRGISQTTLANRAGFDPSYVSRLEHGDRLPSRGTVNNLAVALACTDAEHDTLLVADQWGREPRP